MPSVGNCVAVTRTDNLPPQLAFVTTPIAEALRRDDVAPGCLIGELESEHPGEIWAELLGAKAYESAALAAGLPENAWLGIDAPQSPLGEEWRARVWYVCEEERFVLIGDPDFLQIPGLIVHVAESFGLEIGSFDIEIDPTFEADFFAEAGTTPDDSYVGFDPGRGEIVVRRYNDEADGEEVMKDGVNVEPPPNSVLH